MATTKITAEEFAAECEVSINQFEPEFEYRRADLYGFVKGCWPTEDSPAEVASQFVGEVTRQRNAE